MSISALRMVHIPFHAIVFYLIVTEVSQLKAAPSASKCSIDEKGNRTDCSGRELTSTKVLVNSEEGQKIRSINFSNNNIPKVGGLDRFPNLTYLDLSLNLIENLSSDAFSELKKLSYVDLSYNSLGEINPHIFVHNTQLKSLSFRGNLIKTSPDTPIICSVSLRVLNLSTCALISVTDANLMCLPSLTELDLSSNAITLLTPSVFLPLSHLKVINLRINRFYCDCKISELILWAKSKTTDLSSNEPLYCVFPETRARTEFIKIEKDLNCSTQKSSALTLKPQNENLPSESYDYIVISYDTNIQPADGRIPVGFVGLISNKLYTIEALLSLVLFLLVLIIGMVICRHNRTVGDVNGILNEYSVYDHYFPTDKMSTHLIEKNSTDHMYADVK